jgi:hypothetical protein
MMLEIFLVIWFQDKLMATITLNFFMFGDKYGPREFNDRFKNNRFSRFHKFNCIGDSILLELKHSLCRIFRFEMQFGMDLVILLFERSNSPKFFSRHIFSRMNPLILLPPRYNLCNPSNPQIVDGMFPVKFYYSDQARSSLLRNLYS